VCLYSCLSYPACNAHVPYCHLWPAALYSIRYHHLINGDLRKEKQFVEHKMCILIFSAMPLCPPQIPHGLPEDRSLDFKVTSHSPSWKPLRMENVKRLPLSHGTRSHVTVTKIIRPWSASSFEINL
jgi:hypothetical protein